MGVKGVIVYESAYYKDSCKMEVVTRIVKNITLLNLDSFETDNPLWISKVTWSSWSGEIKINNETKSVYGYSFMDEKFPLLWIIPYYEGGNFINVLADLKRDYWENLRDVRSYDREGYDRMYAHPNRTWGARLICKYLGKGVWEEYIAGYDK